MQQLVDNWEGLLHATGGALVPTKCFWYHIDFHWENTKWVYAKTDQLLGQVAIQNDNNQRVPIPHLATSEARHTLSIRIAPDSNWDTEVDYLTSIAADWKVHMVAARLNSADTIFSLNGI